MCLTLKRYDEQFRTIKYYANPKTEEMIDDFVKKYPIGKMSLNKCVVFLQQ